MNGKAWAEAERRRDDSGRFSGIRFNLENVPRLPTFPAHWALEDLRGRAYLVFWVADDGSLAYLLRVQRIDDGKAVVVATPAGRSRRIEVVHRALPNRIGTTILYRCPVCKRPRRYLYGLAASMRGLVDHFGFQCQACAGLRWASQGRYRIKLERSVAGALGSIYGQPVRMTMPRSPWDPRAVSDPALVAEGVS
jgi:hypothetical protein